MKAKPRVTLASHTRRSAQSVKDFTFSPDGIFGGALGEYRARAWKSYKEQPMPATTDEAWRRTDLRFLPADVFRRAPQDGQGIAEVPRGLLKPLVADNHAGQVVLLPDGARVTLDASLASQGVIFTDLRTAEKQHLELTGKLAGEIVMPEEGKFAALAGALAHAGILLYVPAGVSIEAPLHSLLWAPGAGLAYFSHLLVFIDEGASLTYVHEMASPDEKGDALHAGIVEIRVARGASLRFVEMQSWGRHVWNFTHERIRIAQDGQLDWIFGSVGSRLTKSFMELDLDGKGAIGSMSGFYFTDGNQHLDHDTQQNHMAPNTTSDLLFKGALKGKSRSVWQGMIYVAREAQKTDGYQANRNLVLSDGAHADSIPGLEILADDVRCTHGATVSRLEDEPVFYLRSRGIPKVEAERLIVEGFFDPILQRIPFAGVRGRFQKIIRQKMLSD